MSGLTGTTTIAVNPVVYVVFLFLCDHNRATIHDVLMNEIG